MEKTWKPTATGILNIVTAVISLWFYLALSLEGTVYRAIFPESIFGLNNPGTVYLINTIVLCCIGVLTFLGGIHALKRKKWRLALAGSITACILLLPLGIAAIILIVLSSDEFVIKG